MGGLDIEVRGLCLPIPGCRGPLDLTVKAGTCHGLVGESGSGKTTLLKVLMGEVMFTNGVVRVGPFLLPLRKREERLSFARQVSFIPQDATGSLDPLWPAWRTVTEPFVVHKLVKGRDALRETATLLLKEVGLCEEHLDRKPSQMSGGQCQRVCIARAIATTPGLILADEPVSSLDPILQMEIMLLLASLRRRLATTLILVSHSLGLLKYFAEEITVMFQGEVVETGPTREILSRPKHQATLALLRAEADFLGEGEQHRWPLRPDGVSITGLFDGSKSCLTN